MPRKILAGFVVLLTVIIIAVYERPERVEDLEEDLINAQNFYEIPPLPAKDSYGFIVAEDNIEVIEETVRRNESLYLILRKYDIAPQTIYNIQQTASGEVNLSRMLPGQTYRIYQQDGEAYAMVWHQSMVDYSIITWNDEISVETGSIPIEREESESAGIINRSLYETVQDAGVSQRLGVELADIFGWEIDFFTLRKGDHFKAIYENLSVEGEYLGIGDIMAAEFQHRGNTYRAYYFESDTRRGFFDAEGNSMEKELLKAPFKYNQRISSGFSNNRFHPILKRRRPHHGTDYAAPTGTPIISVGEGVVSEAQYRGGNGNIVQIRHNNSYKTAYLHMNRFASGIRKGAKVEQGQVIGYVGQTGLATGPHLCYRLYVNDRPVNSVRVDLPAAEALEEEHLDEFRQIVNQYEERLDQLTFQDDYAMNDL